MTRYKITYTVKGFEEEYTGSIVERDESKAKKLLKSLLREEGKTLDTITRTSIEVENVPASKEQEREALAEIQAIIDSLGESSYLKTAFAGCFEDAENNIDDDAAYSMKDRWESAERKLAETQKQIATMELDNRDLRLQIDHIKQVAACTEQQLRDKTLSDDDLSYFQELVSESIYETEGQLKEAAEAIVKNAESPSSELFQQAVIDHRNSSRKLDYLKELMNRILAVRQ